MAGLPWDTEQAAWPLSELIISSTKWAEKRIWKNKTKQNLNLLSFYSILNHYNMRHSYSLNLIKITTLESLYYFTDEDDEATVIGDSTTWSLDHTSRTSHSGVRE